MITYLKVAFLQNHKLMDILNLKKKKTQLMNTLHIL